MPTGVEIAGLVLAVVPLLIEVLDRYKNGLEKTKIVAGIRLKDRKRLATKVDGLVRQLNWLHIQLNMNMKRLILVVSPDEDIEKLPQNYNDILWTGPLRIKVEQYLTKLGGKEVVSAFGGAMSNYQILCTEIAEHFEGIIRPPKADKKDLKALCDLRTQCGGKFQFAQRFGFTLHEEDIDRLTSELEEKTRSIGSFIDNSTDLDRLVTQATTNNATRQHIKMTKYLYSTRKYAYALFLALDKVWETDCRHQEHSILLHLDGRCLSQELSLATSIPFHVVFKWLSETGTETFWQESAVVVTEYRRLPNVTFDPSVKGSYPSVEVANACQCIVLAKQNGHKIYFHLLEDKRIFSSQSMAHQHAEILPTEPKLISLHTYLLSKHRKMLARKRIELAVKLASSILQYNETQWFQHGWHKDRIYFFEQTDTFSTAAIDIDHPLISEPFPASSASTQWPDPEDTLLELAVLLMELFHRIRFEDWLTENHPEFDQQNLGDVDFKRTFACKWYKKMARGADFRNVVSICLYPHPLQQFESSWEDDEFRCAFYVHVISPLLAFKL